MYKEEDTFIFCDVDGTLVDDFDNINKNNLEYIKNTCKKFVIVTGRTVPAIQKFLAENGLEIDSIGGNGAFIKCVGEPVEIIGSIKMKTIIEVCEILDREDVIYQLHSCEGSFISNKMDCEIWSKRLAKVHTLVNVKDYHEWYQVYLDTFVRDSIGIYDDLNTILNVYPIIKIEIFSENASLLDRLKKTLELVEDIRIEKSYCTSLEVLNEGVSKGCGIVKYMDKYQKEGRKKSIAIGDNFNDISMFKIVDYPFAVQNCCKELYQYAKILNSSNMECFLSEIECYMEEK